MDNAYGIMGYSEQSQTAKDLVNQIKAACSELARLVINYKSESFSLRHEKDEQGNLLPYLTIESNAEHLNLIKTQLNIVVDLVKQIKYETEMQAACVGITKKVISDFSRFISFDIESELADRLSFLDKNPNQELILKEINDIKKAACSRVFDVDDIFKKVCEIEMWACRAVFNPQTPFKTEQFSRHDYFFVHLNKPLNND